MPNYDLTKSERVVVKVFGKILNENYTRLLKEKSDLDLYAAMLLDKVQKSIRLTKDEHILLKRRELVEGRYPNIYLSSKMASLTEKTAKYIKLRGFNKEYYQALVLAFIKKRGSATRKDIDELLMDKLPDILTGQQKETKIRNMIHEMSKTAKIKNEGSKKNPKWTSL